jgi:hypothetical protein
MTRKNRGLNEKLGRCPVRGCNREKSLSFCRLTKQPLINELADGVDERHCRHDGSSSDYRPKFRVFTEKAHRKNGLAPWSSLPVEFSLNRCALSPHACACQSWQRRTGERVSGRGGLNGEECVGTAKTVVVTRLRARAERATTSEPRHGYVVACLPEMDGAVTRVIRGSSCLSCP